MNPIPALIQVFSSFWIWAVVGVLGTALTAFVNDALSREKNRHQLDHALRNRRWATIYGDLLGAALDRVDVWLTPARAPSPEAAAAEGRRRGRGRCSTSACVSPSPTRSSP